MTNRQEANKILTGIIIFSIYALYSVLIFSIAALNIFFGAAFILWIIKIAVNPDRKFQKTDLDIAFLLYFLTRLISIPLSINISSSLPKIWSELLFFSIYFIITTNFREEIKTKSIYILRILSFTSAAASVIGIYMFLSKTAERAQSTTSGYYTLGIYLTACLAIIMMQPGNKKLFSNKLYYYLYIFITAAGIICTLDRMHWIITGILFIVISIINKDYKPVLIFAGIAAVLILAIPDVGARLMKLIYLKSNMSDRDIVFQGFLNIADKKPVFGFGLNTFSEIFPLKEKLVDKGVGSWHNDYIQIYVESGLVGLLAVLYMIFRIYKTAIKSLKRISSENKNLIIGLMLSLATMFIAGGFIDTLCSFLFRLEIAIIAVICTAPKLKENS
ncbi:MAG TPA: O-antigen ligase family protein [Ignavibacteria bacterium]|nr:O-antigen ligase family protein [Ignavibacteria bacterium]